MRGLKRLLYYLLINIVISAATVWLVLSLWQKRNPTLPEESTPQVVVVTATPAPHTPAPAPATAQPDQPESQATVTQAPLPTPTLELVEYIVQEGDTVGSIADQFEISIEAIVYVNQLSDPNSISVGQTLYIPVGGLVIPTETTIPPTQVASPTPRPSLSPTTGPSPTTAPTLTGDEPQVYIDSVVGVGDLSTERVLLRRSGLGELSLAGWQLSDRDGNVYTFPQLTLYEGGAVSLNTRTGTNTVVDLFWNLGAAVWRPGEQVSLLDATGTLRAIYYIP